MVKALKFKGWFKKGCKKCGTADKLVLDSIGGMTIYVVRERPKFASITKDFKKSYGFVKETKIKEVE